MNVIDWLLDSDPSISRQVDEIVAARAVPAPVAAGAPAA
jgi:hypothetical protein